MNNISPACRPTVCEKQYDYIRDSTFYRPSFVIYRNNEPLSVNDDFNIDYSYAIVKLHFKSFESRFIWPFCYQVDSMDTDF